MMSPIPDDPGKNPDDVDDMESPQYIINAESDSDSDHEDDPTYLGYQPLPQVVIVYFNIHLLQI